MPRTGLTVKRRFANPLDVTKQQLLAILRLACERAGSQAAWARANGMSSVYVSDVLSGRREPAGKLLAALGVERAIAYRKVREGG